MISISLKDFQLKLEKDFMIIIIKWKLTVTIGKEYRGGPMSRRPLSLVKGYCSLSEILLSNLVQGHWAFLLPPIPQP